MAVLSLNMRGLVIASLGSGYSGGGSVRDLVAVSAFTKAQVEEEHGSQHADPGNRPGVFDEISEGVTEGRADDDIRRVAAHGGAAADISGKNRRDDNRHRVEFQQAGQFDDYRRHEEQDGNTINKHGQKTGKEHKANQNWDDLVSGNLGHIKAQPVKEPRLGHTLHHYHHAGNKDDGLPVDAAGFYCLVPRQPELPHHQAGRDSRH